MARSKKEAQKKAAPPKKARAARRSAHQIKLAAQRAENIKTALEYRKTGMTYAQIGELMERD